jgi:hypothetical protein
MRQFASTHCIDLVFGQRAARLMTTQFDSSDSSDDYDAADDFARSIEHAYALIRQRKANGGKGWKPKHEQKSDARAIPTGNVHGDKLEIAGSVEL